MALVAALATLPLPADKPAAGIQFRDITRAAGLHFTHNNGAFGKKYLPETLGFGCAFLDYDNDGWQDIFLVKGKDWPGHRRQYSTPISITTTTMARSPT